MDGKREGGGSGEWPLTLYELDYWSCLDSNSYAISDEMELYFASIARYFTLKGELTHFNHALNRESTWSIPIIKSLYIQ